MFVSRVANYPSRLIPYPLITSSIPFNSTSPCRSFTLIDVSLTNNSYKVFLYYYNFFVVGRFEIFSPLYIERL